MEFSSLNTYIRLVIFCIGIPGNILTIFVMCRRKFKRLNIRVLFIALAMSDTLVLAATNGLVTIASLSGTFAKVFNTDVYCRFGNFLIFYLPQTSSYILVCIALERMIAVVYPHKAKIWCTKKNTTIALALVILLPALMNIDIIQSHKLLSMSSVRGNGHFHGEVEDGHEAHSTGQGDQAGEEPHPPSVVDHHDLERHGDRHEISETRRHGQHDVDEDHTEVSHRDPQNGGLHHDNEHEKEVENQGGIGLNNTGNNHEKDNEPRNHLSETQEYTGVQTHTAANNLHENIDHSPATDKESDHHEEEGEDTNRDVESGEGHHEQRIDDERYLKSEEEHEDREENDGKHGDGDHSEHKEEKDERMVCQYEDVAANHYFYSYVKTPIDITIYCFIPFAILLMTNGQIIVAVLKSKKFREETNNIKDIEKENKRNDDVTKMIGMLLSTCAVFILTTLPSGIYLCLPSVPHEDKFSPDNVLRGSLQTLLSLNYAINFYLYVFTGPAFRRELLVMFGFTKSLQRSMSSMSSQMTKSTNALNSVSEIESAKH